MKLIAWRAPVPLIFSQNDQIISESFFYSANHADLAYSLENVLSIFWVLVYVKGESWPCSVQLQPQSSYYWTSSSLSRTFIDLTSFVGSTSTTEISQIIESFQKFIYLSIAWKHRHNSHTQYWSRPSCSFACQYVFITAGSFGRAVGLLICFSFLFQAVISSRNTNMLFPPEKPHTDAPQCLHTTSDYRSVKTLPFWTH